MAKRLLQDLECALDLGQCVSNHFLVAGNSQLREHQPLVRDVVDHVRVVVGIDRTDPLVHARACPDIFGLQGRPFKRFIDIGRDCAGFVERKIAVLKDRDAIERMQREVAGRAHLRFEIAEAMGNAFMGEHQPDDMDIGAAWETKYDDVGHGGGFRGMNLSPGQAEFALQTNHVFSSLPQFFS